MENTATTQGVVPERTVANFRPTHTVVIGNVTLPYVAHPHTHYIPLEQNIVNNEDIIRAIAIGIKEHLPILLVGETGTGKTTLVKHVAHLTGNALRRINLNGNTTVDEIVGKYILQKDGMLFVYGLLADSMRNGHWVLFDEFNAGLPEVLLVLQSVLEDNDGKLTIVEKDGEVLVPHPAFRFFATMNPTDGYVGTKELNPATLSRFFMAIQVPYPTVETEMAIIKTKLPENPRVSDVELREAVTLANDIRNGHKQGEYRFAMSTRDLIYWMKANEHYGNLVESARYTILGKCNDDDRNALESVLKVYFATKTGDVKASDGKTGTKLKKGMLVQVCDEVLEISRARDGRSESLMVKSGSVFEVVSMVRGEMMGRLMRGEVWTKESQRAVTGEYKTVPVDKVELSHTEAVRLNNAEMASLREIKS